MAGPSTGRLLGNVKGGGITKKNNGKKGDTTGERIAKAVGDEKEEDEEEEEGVDSMLTDQTERELKRKGKQETQKKNLAETLLEAVSHVEETKKAPGGNKPNESSANPLPGTDTNGSSGQLGTDTSSGNTPSGGATGTGGKDTMDQLSTGEMDAGSAQDDIPIPSVETEEKGGEDEDEDDDMDDDDDEDDDELRWSPTLNRKKAGLRKWDLRIVGKIKRWKQVKFVMANGPMNSVSYRIHKSQDMEAYDDPDAPNLQEDRIGDIRDGKGKMVYKKYAKGIRAVAWFVDRDLLERFPDEFPREEDLLKPRKRAIDFPILYQNFEKGHEEVKRMKIVECLVQIEYLIDEKREKRWETRSIAREIWGIEKADRGIYAAAQDQEERFRNWQKGKRPGKDQSATPGPGLSPDRDTRSPTPGPEKRVHFGKSGERENAPKQSLEAWRADYCEMAGKQFLQMTLQEKTAMMGAWKDYRDE